ncbi:MAG: type II toxin-antitoxin system prevent-host-death family antitoxin [Actinomycetota bacterium]
MKQVKIAELKDKLSEHLRAVERGELIEVTDRNRPIARIVPMPDADPLPTLIPPAKDFSMVRDIRHPQARWDIDSTTLLLEERQSR